MDAARREDASFRDPAGQVYWLGERVLRSVTSRGVSDYEFVRDSGFLDQPLTAGHVIGSREVSTDMLQSAASDIRYLLEHKRVPFISYPYEWCFSALQSAALLQLDLLEAALRYDITMADASAYNFQFDGTTPILIDLLSLQRYGEGQYWKAHRQFCEQFLNPLLLSAYAGIPFNAWFRGAYEGIPSGELSRLLPTRRKLDWRVLMHVILPARFQNKAQSVRARQVETIERRTLPRASFAQMIASMRKWIAGLTPAKPVTATWADYETANEYDTEAADAKRAFTKRFASVLKPRVLWDIGCNTGAYATAALESGAQLVIGFDFAPDVVEAAFVRAKRDNLAFLPLVMDGANPSPAQGWRGRERKSLEERGGADAVIAFAFVHHLAIGRNIPLDEIVAWLVALAPTGAIEFVAKDDPMIVAMLRLREDIFDGYHKEAFLGSMRRVAEIREIVEVIPDRRWIVWYSRDAK